MGDIIPPIPDWLSYMYNMFDSTPGVVISILDINNQSAKLNCSWRGRAAENTTLSWSVGDKETKTEEVKVVGEGSIILNIVWSERNVTAGEGLWVTCSGQARDSNLIEMSNVTELIIM